MKQFLKSLLVLLLIFSLCLTLSCHPSEADAKAAKKEKIELWMTLISTEGIQSVAGQLEAWYFPEFISTKLLLIEEKFERSYYKDMPDKETLAKETARIYLEEFYERTDINDLEKNTFAVISSYIAAVGDKYVYECMQKHGYRLGGEQSGHIIFSKYASTGDGLITAIKLMEVLLETKTPFSKLTEALQIYPQITKNVRVKDKNLAAADPEVVALSEAINRDFAGNGRLLVRKSGTEPLVRIMAEAETAEICHEVIGRIEALLETNGHTL